MSDKTVHAKKHRPGCLAALFLWPFRGRWWVKTLKLTLVAVILYNVIAFFLMWCPPVRGVVVDIDTGKPIRGAIVQKFGEGPFIFPSEKIEGLHVAGADAQATTGANGRFSFPPAAVRPTPGKAGWLGTLYPFQWFNTVKVRVWEKDYIGVNSYKKGLWWSKSNPRDSGGYCKVVRYRIPFIGFFYRISLKKAVTEKEWVTKIGSVNLSGLPLPQSKDVEQQRLFDDLTGYLERWPKGEKAGFYFQRLLETGLVESCGTLRGDWRERKITRQELLKYYKRNKRILSLVSKVSMETEPIAAHSEERAIQAMRGWLPCAEELLELSPATERRQ